MALLSALFATASSTAHAQLRWDVGARVGVGKRMLNEQPEGVRDGNAGPAAELTLHTSLLPLLRIGPTLSSDISPIAGRPTRRHYGLGLEARLFAPLPWPTLRPFLFVGFRGVLVRQPETEVHPSGGGNYWSVPFGLGVSAAVVRHVRFVMTVGGESAFLHAGSVYDPSRSKFSGNDVAAVRGLVGADFEF